MVLLRKSSNNIMNAAADPRQQQQQQQQQRHHGRNQQQNNIRLFVMGFLVVLVGWKVVAPVIMSDGPTTSSITKWMMVEETATATATTATAGQQSPQQRQKNKQRKVFIDLGVNCGNSYYRFKAGKEIGSRTTLSSPDWEAYLWEANPQMIEWYLNDLVKNETALGMKNVHLIPKAAATRDGTISFFLTKGQGLGIQKDRVPNSNCDPNSAYNPSGASTLYGGAQRAGEEVQVPAVDFLAWFKSLNLQAGDIVHVKADIEGAEVDILEAFLADDTNQICLWSQFWTEYHASIFPDKNSAEYKRHSEFEKSFPGEFEKKCGRMPWPNGVLH